MSDRHTVARPRERGLWITGWSVEGRKSRAEMLEEFRKYHQAMLDESKRALELSDEEIIVVTGYGIGAHRKTEEVIDD